MIDFNRPPFVGKELDYIKEAVENKRLCGDGIFTRKCSDWMEEHYQVKHVMLTTSCTHALEMAAYLAGIQPGDEVIMPSYTFVSTADAFVLRGAKIVFVDIRPDTMNIDETKIEAAITDKTKAIVPVHYAGVACEMDTIMALAKKHHLKVIYDAAHTFGVTYKGRGVATFGDASMFSFHATKVFHTIEGGAVCFNGEQNGLKEDLYGLKNFGIRNEVVVDAVGANSKMNEFQAAMGLCNLRHLDGEIEKRSRVVARYREHLNGVPGIKLVQPQKDVKPNYAYFPVVFDETVLGYGRDDIYEMLKQHDIFTRKYFYPLTSEFQCYSDKYDAKDTPVALETSKRVLTLPLYADLDLSDVDRICELILGYRA